jgi:hypothetical protein
MLHKDNERVRRELMIIYCHLCKKYVEGLNLFRCRETVKNMEIEDNSREKEVEYR